MAQAGDYEQKAKEAEALAASSRHYTFKIAFQKMARDYRALAEAARRREVRSGCNPKSTEDGAKR
jgi:hypothetical protein